MSDIAIARFSALAHDVRYKAFRLLANAGQTGICAGDISKSLKISPSTLSPHLAQLERCGLINKTRDGTKLVYAIHPENVAGLIDHIISDCCGGRPELCGGAVKTG
ncbi:ArsR/SmtB family transcription factor [Hirschia baltica]|uniref:Transcriptional regulator, ArsR family n=1 Tax=Hirschia baltica (strain ATCC 49814 / DSM 5838 / IFAM 1418) TaxID=582402 RepID=C6XKY2_HIRBI|nr:metalloregulator ArsR/SmtB family transcription factor [Hirschia baltica]ACT57811.1 transcriptional regulator, ArsR family [Hirschia baltica ATCC 49814]